MTGIQRFRERLSERGIPAALISNVGNAQWLTGFSGSSAFVLVTPTDGVLITDSRYRDQAPEQVKELEVRIYQTPQTAAEIISEEAKSRGIASLAFEAEHVSFATHGNWQTSIEAELKPEPDLIDSLRMAKSVHEVNTIREACRLADKTFEHIQRLFQVGVTEYDIALEIEFFIRRNGAKLAFDVIAVSGERSARPHGEPSEKKLEQGDFVTVDFGANVDGWNSDLTRTVVIGNADSKHERIYNAVLESQLEALAMMKPGVPCKDVDAKAREVLAGYDLAQYFGHGLGHGLGRSVHDFGSLSSASKSILEEGQVWTVEPGAYVPGVGGVRIEDDVVITADGIEVLTHSPKHLMVF